MNNTIITTSLLNTTPTRDVLAIGNINPTAVNPHNVVMLGNSPIPKNVNNNTFYTPTYDVT